MSSRLVQWIAGMFARVLGVPAAVTRRLLAAGGQFIREGGLIGLIRLVKRDPKEIGRAHV